MTKRVVLIGHPVAHSLSGGMQQAAFDAEGLDIRYELWDRAPLALPDAIAELRGEEFVGANVTIPNKEKVVPLEEIIRKMTAMPAWHLGLARRGLLKQGYAADITVFDPARVIDKATWTDPARYPEGIPHVVVNGRAVVHNGEHTGSRPGRVLRRNPRGLVE